MISAPSLATAAARIAAWRRDPVLFVRENFRVEPDAWQREALEAAADPAKSRIAMKACAGPGKSAVLAWIALWFLTCCAEPGHHPNAYAVSITGDNLADNLWKELAVWRERSAFLTAVFEHTSEKIFAREHEKTWWLKARSFPKSANAEAQGRTLSGLHAKYIAYFLDEGGDMPTSLLRTAQQGLMNCHWGKIFLAGNPTSMTGALYEAVVHQAHRYHVIEITGDPDDPRRSSRISLDEARAEIAQWGRDNAWVMAFILGKFPPTSFNQLLGADDIRDAMRRSFKENEYANVQKRLGVDVARFGDDSTVIFPRQGRRAFMPAELRTQNGPQIAARVATAKAKWGSEMEFIDDTGGWGGSTIDQAQLAGIALIPVNSSHHADDPRFFNKRSEMYWRAAEWVKNGGWLPNVGRLVREGSAATYYLDGGKLRVIEKAQIKKNLAGQSPDFWDAFCLTFAIPDMPTSMESVLATLGIGGLPGMAGKMASEWDPFGEPAHA